MKRMSKTALRKFVPVELKARAEAARARANPMIEPPEAISPHLKREPLEFREDVIGEFLDQEAEAALRGALFAIRSRKYYDADRLVVQLDTILDLRECLFGDDGEGD